MKDLIPKAPTIRQVRPIDIFTIGPRRALNPETLEALTLSIDSIGLQHPITVRVADRIEDPEEGEVLGAYVLVAGAHRLAAVRELGLTFVPCHVTSWTEAEARRWELSENLHRSELTVQERSDHIAEWVQLTEVARQAEPVLAQTGPKSRRGRPESGVRAAARELGLERKVVDRALKIAAIVPEAKAAARAAGLDNRQNVLLAISQAEPERQVEAVREIGQQLKPVTGPISPDNSASGNVVILADHRPPTVDDDELDREAAAQEAADDIRNGPSVDIASPQGRAAVWKGALSSLDLTEITGDEFWSNVGNSSARGVYSEWVRTVHRKLTDILLARGNDKSGRLELFKYAVVNFTDDERREANKFILSQQKSPSREETHAAMEVIDALMFGDALTKGDFPF